MSTKVCIKCNQEKPLSDFNKHVRMKDGIRNSCRICDYISKKEWKKNNKDKVREEKRRYIERRKNVIKEKKPPAQWERKICNGCNVEKNRDEYYFHSGGICKECEKLRQKRYRQNNPTQRKITKKKWNKNNPELYKKFKKESKKRKKQRDPVYRAILSIRARLSNFINKNHLHKSKKFKDIIGIDYDGFKDYIESQFLEGMSWDNRSIDGWHLDHIIPISSAKTIEDVERLNHYTNFQPLWAEDNMKKGDMIL